MPKTNEQLKELKEQRISQIIGAALKVFCEKGYDATSVDDVCKKAGVSHGLFYHYFNNKKTLFQEVMARKRMVIHDDLLSEINLLSSNREKIKLIINALFDNMKNDENAPYYFFLFLSGMFNRKEKKLPPPDNNARPKKHFFDLFKELFISGQKNGEFSDAYPPEEYTKLLHSIIQGATLAYIVAPKELQKHISFPNVDMILDIFSKGENNDLGKNN
jgi:AcrR family transcriptional regulator